jgi:chloramphenicol O-acetyltransferase type A
MDQPHFSLTANVDIAAFLDWQQKADLPFTPALVYLLVRTAHDIPAFRQRIRGEEVVEHLRVHPSFSVLTKVSEVFSFCTVDYDPDPTVFIPRALDRIRAMQTRPSFEDEPGRDDFFYLSGIPWVSFTGLTHAMHYHPVDSVPRISWGKYFRDPSGRVLMPLSVQAHHALVDGRHVGQYYEQFQAYAHDPGPIFRPGG